MSSTIHAIARRALVLAGSAALILSTVPAAGAASLDELMELSRRAWAGETELLAQVYAPDAVHTTTFYDRTTEYVGPERMPVMPGHSSLRAVAPRVDIPAPEGEYRWAEFISLGGGSACLWRAVDGLVTRQDCLVPERSNEARAGAGLADAETSAAIDALVERLDGTWGPDNTVEKMAAVYAPDAVHSARFPNVTRQYVGPEEIISVSRAGIPIERIGPRIDFEAPEGELAWAQVNSLAGGSLCLFHAVDDMITRHDCVVPVKG